MTVTLRAKKRTFVGKKSQLSRKLGFIPAVLYGHRVENINLEVSENEFIKIYTMAGESTLLDLKIEPEIKEPLKVIIQNVQVDPVRGKFLHIDFHQVNMYEKIHTHIKLKYRGEAPAVKSFGGVLVTNKNQIEVQCLPLDLVPEIEVDLSVLKNINDVMRVKDISVSQGIEILDLPQEIIATVIESHTEKEAEAMKGTPTEVKVEPEVVSKKEKETTDTQPETKLQPKPGGKKE